jgi:prolyl oligopeptidase
VSIKRGGRYFYTCYDGLQNQGVLYWQESLVGEPHILLDPNALSDDGTLVLAENAINEDGRFLAYGLSDSGSDWQGWHVSEVDTGRYVMRPEKRRGNQSGAPLYKA